MNARTYEAVDALGWGMDYEELPPPADHAPTRDATIDAETGEFVVWEPENHGAAIWSDTVIEVRE